MEILTELEGFEQISYMARWLRWCLSIFCGIALVYISEPDKWANLHRYTGFLPAILVSCSLAIGFGEYIHALSIWLDKKWSWLMKNKYRWCLQLLMGVVLPISLAVLALFFYFEWYNLTLADTTYFERVFYPTCLLLILVNAYYRMHFFVQLNRLVAKQKHVERLQTQNRILEEKQQAQKRLSAKDKAKLELELPSAYEVEDIALIFSQERKLLWFSISNEKLHWPKTIAKTVGVLLPEDFYRVSKSCIVARSNIKQAFHCSSKVIELQLCIPEARYITVSQRASHDFKIWYKLAILPKRALH